MPGEGEEESYSFYKDAALGGSLHEGRGFPACWIVASDAITLIAAHLAALLNSEAATFHLDLYLHI